jgi:predicted glycoside hydrolase/deacetylase ChbG (UPF0249 family)
VIINADDLGLTSAVTDSILKCFHIGAISSTSMMVWMDDSDRAASLVRDDLLPTGLHLNLDTPFSVPCVPRYVREAQADVCPWFVSHSSHLLAYNVSRRFQRSLATTIQAQLDEFRSRLGAEPSHIDGHHHVHLAWNVLVSRMLPDGIAVRSTKWEESSQPARILHLCRHGWIHHRFRTTDLFFDLRRIAVELGGAAPQALLRPGRQNVEVMAHPGHPDELVVLLSQPWHELIAGLPIGSFHDLR